MYAFNHECCCHLVFPDAVCLQTNYTKINFEKTEERAGSLIYIIQVNYAETSTCHVLRGIPPYNNTHKYLDDSESEGN